MAASDLRHRVTFSQRAVQSDGAGNSEADWSPEFTVAARIWPRLGGETVMAARLESRQPVTITVRQSSQTREITTDWMATNARTNVNYAIRSIVDPDEHTARHGMYFDLLCEAGVAV